MTRERDGQVIYIAGFGRSGSTLFSQVAGAVPGVVNVGELVWLWQRGVLRNEACGCGMSFSECEFWGAVGDRAFGGWDQASAARHHEEVRRVARQRHVALNVVGRRSGRALAMAKSLVSAYESVCEAIRDVSGCSVVVDSSKQPSFLALLGRHAEREDVRVVQVTRDPRATAYSWSRPTPRPEATSSDDAKMIRFSPAMSALQWMVRNESARWAARSLPRVGVHYEDFVASPAQSLRRVGQELRIGAFLGESWMGNQIQLPIQHTVSGNPARFKTGPLTLRMDERWKTQMPPPDRRLVAALTGPLRWRYGY